MQDTKLKAIITIASKVMGKTKYTRYTCHVFISKIIFVGCRFLLEYFELVLNVLLKV